MENSSLCGSLLKWLETFPGRQGTRIVDLTDGVLMANVLHQIAPEYFTDYWLTRIKTDVGDNWRLKVSNLRKVQQGVVEFYQEQLNQSIRHFPLPDLNKIGEHGDEVEMGRMLQLLLGCAVNCENKQQYIEAIMNMEERVQKVIMEAIQELMLREGSPGAFGPDGEGRGEALGLSGLGGPASFHPHLKTILEQLEAATQGKEEAIQTCHELEQQISVLKEEKGALAGENERLVGRLEAWEAGADLGAGSSSTLRYKDLRKQIEGLQDELFKLETSRDEYRSRAEVLERENTEVQGKNEELQQLADQARSLKDEVDVLREMSERAVVYEGTVETYKKKLEELSDLKRQMRILEEKNSDYMQHNMELEEELKKSGTWRPQLDMYKKQVAELHQKLAEEAKKTDRQIFENKKLAEKMEAVVQERDRLAKERDSLKENIEELKCHISTITSPDTASRPPSDLSDVELLDAVPHEFRERLMRLQYENSVLKKAAEGGSSEQLPMLQTLVADLQERQASLTQENRWGSSGGDLEEAGGFFSPHGKRRSGGSLSPPLLGGSFTLPEARFSGDRKLRVIRRNLKWASESDLLILRQPKGLFFHPSSPSSPPPMLPFSQPSSLPPLPSTSTSSTLATQTSKEVPIIIRHIHEFKIPPSPTNEDSGCCRTSPSSCEDEGHTRDFPGTLDSGISGMFPGTLESGVSGAYRCLSPVIPPIVEECTAHHLTDLLPQALLGGPTTILHHSHPAHTSTCLHCCSPSLRQTGRAVSPTQTPRPHSVCSYNPPHYKTPTTSSTPSSTHPDTSTHSSPPLSPLTHTTTSLTHTQTHSSPSPALPKLTIDVRANQPSPSPPPPLTTTATSPTGRRGAAGGYTRTPIPPESPTPHNSPRLPNSINATRCRSGGGGGSKVSSPTLGLHEELKDLKDLKDIPTTASFTQGHAGASDKTTRPQETVTITPQIHPTEDKSRDTVGLDRGNSTRSSIIRASDRTARPQDTIITTPQIHSTDDKTQGRETVGLERGDGTRTSIRRRSESEDGRRRSVGEGSPTNSTRKATRSGVPTRSPSQPPDSRLPRKKDVETVIVSCLPPPSIQAIRRTEGRIERNSPAYSSMKPRYDVSALERNSPLRASISSHPSRERGKAREVNGAMNVASNSGIPSPSIQLVKVEKNGNSSTPITITSTPPVTPSITSITTQPLRDTDASKHTDGRTRNTQGAHSPMPHPIASITPIAPVSLARQPSEKSRQSPRGSLKLTGDRNASLPGKSPNHVKFREPVVSQVTQSDVPQTATPQYSPASPRERMSPPHAESTTGRKAKGTDTLDKPGMDKHKVTLLSDTLFTRFEVASPSRAPTHPNMRRVHPVAPSDTDTDLETLERRLTQGMYAAPLVSSESCTSFSHDDYTASDDPECYDPLQFKPYGDLRRRRRVNAGPRRSLTPPPTPPKVEPAHESALGRTYSFFRTKTKSKTKIKPPEKEVFVPPLGQAGRVVKARNKTAKVVVAETLNAVFTLCTP